MVSQEKRIHACWLNGVPGIGNRTIDKLLALCGDERGIYMSGPEAWRQVMTARQLEQMECFARKYKPEQVWEELSEKGIRFIMREEDDYPTRLKPIPDPPYGLYVKGNLPQADGPSVAVVGARDCSEYGKFVAAGIGRELGEKGVQVISGMARGIDGISQRAALDAGGCSFGVLGCGVDVCYPPSNRELYEVLCQRGGVLSAYPPGTEAKPGNFPPRNRIVSGLADVLIVVEARVKSGTSITVDMALEQGKDVYVVPGRITDRLSDGCNRLLKQGADILISPEEFLQELGERWCCGPVGRISGFEKGEKKQGKLLQWRMPSKVDKLSEDAREIYEILTFDPMTPEQILTKTPCKYALPKLMSMLMALCVDGFAVQVGPCHFARKGDSF